MWYVNETLLQGTESVESIYKRGTWQEWKTKECKRKKKHAEGFVVGSPALV